MQAEVRVGKESRTSTTKPDARKVLSAGAVQPAASISGRERKTPHDRATGVTDSGQICHFSSAAERCFREDQTPRSELGALLLHYSLGSREDGDS